LLEVTGTWVASRAVILARHTHCPRARLPVVQLIHPETHLVTRTKTQALREGTETLCPGRF
ncbi:MAG: hypothetical protein V3R16_11020, partial [Nitrospirales bacterium]